MIGASVVIGLVAGCVTHDPYPEVCEPVESPLTPGEVSPLGFSADEMIDELESSRSRWDIAWTEPAGAASTLAISVVSIGQTQLIAFDPASAEMPCPEDAVRAELQIEVASVDGEIASSGPAVLTASSLGEPLVDLSFTHEVTLGSAASAMVEAALPAGAVATGVEISSSEGTIGIDAQWSSADGDGATTVYRCKYSGARDPSTADCVVMSAP